MFALEYFVNLFTGQLILNSRLVKELGKAVVNNYCIKQEIPCSAFKLNELSFLKPSGIWTRIAVMPQAI